MPIEIKRPTRARRSAGLLLGLGLAVFVAGMSLVVFLGDWAVNAKAPPPPARENSAWNVAIDPGPQWGEPAIPANATISTSTTNVIYPSTPAPFVAVNPVDDPKAWQVYDLRTWTPLGWAQKLHLSPFMLPVLSPDGRYLACKVPAKGPAVEIRWVERGVGMDRIHTDFGLGPDFDPGMAVAAIDFAGKDQILIGTARANVYEDIAGDWDVVRSVEPPSPGTYQVSYVPGPFKGLEFSASRFHATKAGLSPGRNYLVIEEFDEKEGHRLVFHDLRTGKPGGSLSVQDAGNPRGHPVGLSFSRDGKQLALLWRLNERPDRWGQLMCWDVATGKKILEHDVGYLLASMDLLWTHGGTRSIRWLADDSGWLLFGHLVLRREDGTLIRKIPPEPASASEIIDRVFLTPDRYTHFDSKARKLSVRTLK